MLSRGHILCNISYVVFAESMRKSLKYECIQQYDYNRDEHNIISGISHKRERERETDPINNLNSSSCLDCYCMVKRMYGKCNPFMQTVTSY